MTEPIQIELPKRLDVSQVETLKEELRKRLDNGTSFTFDAAGVDRVDGAGLQLLVAFVRKAKSSSGEVNWVGTSGRFASAAHTAGLESELGLPESATAEAAS